jgi:SAM-dependent methyltransferase
MSFKSTSASWEWLAQRDFLWAICTHPTRRNRGWDLEQFFATGEREIDSVFAYLEQKGLAPSDRTLALDFGCGVGRLTRALGTRFDEAHGVDVSPTMIARARELNAGHPRLKFFLNERPDLRQFPDAAYALVYSSIVLQHISYPESLGYISELIRLTRPGGLVVFQTPTLDRTRLPTRMARSALRFLVQALKLPVDSFHMEMNVVPEARILETARNAGCEVLDVVYSNSVDAASGGSVRFFDTDRGARLVSRQFVLRKGNALAHSSPSPR